MNMNKYFQRVTCAEPLCKESANYGYETRADEKSGREWQKKHPFRCARHSMPEKVLSLSNLHRETVLVAQKGARCGDKLFWNGTNGFAHGDGYKAFADDFPEGTKLIVTARIEIPTA
jgi:hypothetical protein